MVDLILALGGGGGVVGVTIFEQSLRKWQNSHIQKLFLLNGQKTHIQKLFLSYFVSNGTNYSYSKIKNISIAEACTLALTLDSHIHPAF